MEKRLIIKLIILIVIAVALFACQKRNVKTESTNYVIGNLGEKFEILTIDNCQYIYYSGGDRMAITHKGNCKNH